MCIHPCTVGTSVSLCVCVYAFVHVSSSIRTYIIMCSAEPEVAVLDCTALKQIQYIGKGKGGVAGLQIACEAHIQGGKVLGHPTRIFGGILDSLILTTSAYLLCRPPLPGHSYIISPFHPYIAFMPVQFLQCISINCL